MIRQVGDRVRSAVSWIKEWLQPKTSYQAHHPSFTPLAKFSQKASALLMPPLRYRTGCTEGFSHSRKWVTYTIALAIVSFVTNFLGLRTILSVPIALLAAFGLQLAASAAGFEIVRTPNRKAAWLFVAAWVILVWICATFDAIALSDAHFAFEQRSAAPTMARNDVREAAITLAQATASAQGDALGALAHESRALNAHITAGQQRLAMGVGGDQTTRQIDLTGLQQRAKIVDSLSSQWAALSMDTSQIDTLSPADGWKVLNQQYARLVELWSASRAAVPGANFQLPTAPVPPVTGLDDVVSGQSDMFYGPLSRLWPWPKGRAEAFFVLLAVGFETPPLILALALAVSKKQRDDQINNGEDASEAQNGRDGAENDDEKTVSDWDRRERLLRRQGDALDQYDRDTELIRDTTTRCKLAARDAMDNHTLGQFLAAKREKLAILQHFVETAGVLPHKAQELFEQVFKEVQIELEYRRQCAENEQRKRIDRNRLDLAKEIAAIKNEMEGLEQDLTGVSV